MIERTRSGACEPVSDWEGSVVLPWTPREGAIFGLEIRADLLVYSGSDIRRQWNEHGSERPGHRLSSAIGSSLRRFLP